jgi:flagellar basal-body rod protein FlgB
MGLSDIPILSMLRTRLQWAQERQRVLAENVANSDTPNFQPRDLTPPVFGDPTRVAASSVANVAMATTEQGHIAGALSGVSPFRSSQAGAYDVHPTGNAVNLEEEMMKVAANNMDYQAATALYTRSLNLFKVALGKK